MDYNFNNNNSDKNYNSYNNNNNNNYDNHEAMEFKNQATLEIECEGEKKFIKSNEVEAKKISVKLEKDEDKDCVFKGDTITYTVKVKNESKLDLNDAVFCDDIPDGLKYETGSFKVDGVSKMPNIHGQKLSYTLFKCKKECDTVIVFKVKVL